MPKVASTIIFALLCSTAVSAWAETVPPQSADTTTADTTTADAGIAADIIVTAQKRSERINDVPLAISALSSDQLRSRGITDTTQLERVVPGFTVQKSYFGQPIFFIRGVGYADTVISINPAVSVYDDEVPLPFSAMARGAAIDLERVEVLKGPQGILFGQNSTGGAVNYIAAKPTDEFHSGIDLSIGRFTQIDGTAFVSGPLSDTLSARIAVQSESSNDWQRSISRPSDTRGAERFINGRVTLDFHPGSTVRFRLTGQAWQDRSDLQAQQYVLAVPQIPVSPPADPAVIAFLAAQQPAPDNARLADWDAGSPKARRDRFYQGSLRADVDLTSAITLTSLTGYSDLKAFTPADIDGTAFPNDFVRINATLKAFNQELRLAGTGDRLNWLIGGNYSHRDTKETQLQNQTATNNNTTPFTYHIINLYDFQRVDNYAVFANADYKITETFSVRAGGRYNKENRRFTGCLADAGDGQFALAFAFLSTILSGSPSSIGPGQCITLDDVTAKPLGGFLHRSLNEENFSWRVGADWKPVPGTLVYANIAKGYKSGSFTAVPAIFASQAAPITQESVLSYEIGLKSALLDQRLQVNLAAFYYDYRNKQLQGFVSIPPFGNLPALVNIPKSTVKGAEFDVTARPTRHLRMQVSGTVLDTEVTKDTANPVCPLNGPCSFLGESFPNTPKYQLTADVEQRFPVGDRDELYFGGGLLYHSSTTGSFGSRQSAAAARAYGIPAYTLLDLRAGIEFDGGRWLAEIYGRNVTNKFYIVNASRTVDEITRFSGRPATYGVRVSWRL